jgi:hypothetical protein
MSPAPARFPTPLEIAEVPELAILAALEHTLDLALYALLAAHPQLGDSDCPSRARDSSPAQAAADRIVTAAVPLGRALHAYRRAVTPSLPENPDPDVPF